MSGKMDKSYASHIQSYAAKNPTSNTASSGFAVRAQSAADKNVYQASRSQDSGNTGQATQGGNGQSGFGWKK
ncbi:hypothetical protein MMC30_006662 [Trapelia coarctata]|nr:hypothetical protein [Trapelia coarctata]